ncbi:Dimer Tnp hAT domain-containing protein [Aphis craccivora]|uniref:Dimer Tnp hAT domain-containing protein n=1 Tax=Aphis craccivora TaxID=307492 RepID=A0A6G0VIU5_APHCR|nr:Dimer Tnp hAT domain-containing protein [Aphis craccivora]
MDCRTDNICKFALTAPVNVATNERSSKGNDSMDSLMILSVEKDVVDQLDINKIATLWGTFIFFGTALDVS